MDDTEARRALVTAVSTAVAWTFDVGRMRMGIIEVGNFATPFLDSRSGRRPELALISSRPAHVADRAMLPRAEEAA